MHGGPIVQAEGSVLFDIACGPDSVLTENMRGMTGCESSAKRFAFWNGYDVSTSQGVRSIIAAIERGKTEHVWLSLERGPFSIGCSRSIKGLRNRFKNLRRNVRSA